MKNLRITSDPCPPPELFGWSIVPVRKQHHFAIKNICAYAGPSMIYDSALNGNYYAIRVNDPERVDEIRQTFTNIIFEEDDIASTRLSYYTKSKLIEKYMEALDNE